MSKKNQATRTVIILSILSFLSKILGFVRESLIASRYGSGSNTDAFFLALTTISMFSIVISSSVGTTLIPILSDVEKSEGKEGKKHHLNNFLNVIALVGVLMVIIAIIFAPQFLKILAVGFDAEAYALVTLLSRMGAPVIFFSAIIGVFKGYLESEGLFKQTAIAMFLSNIVLITFLILFASMFDVRALMVAYVLAQAAPLVILLYSLNTRDYKYEFIFNLKDPYMIKVMRMIPPILIGVAISDINALADNSMASTLASGSVSALQYARRIEGITMGIFITSLMTVIFPMLSSQAAKDDNTEFKGAISQGMNTISLITIPATVGMIVLGTPIIRLAFERGKFTPADTIMAAGALTFYSIGLASKAMNQLINRAFYSLQDTKTPTVISGIAVGINIALNFAFISGLQHRGLALATSLSNIATTVLILYALRKKIGPLGVRNMITVFIKSSFASIIMGAVVYFSFEFTYSLLGFGTMGLLLALLVAVIFGVAVYFVVILLLKVEELDVLVKQVKNKVVKS